MAMNLGKSIAGDAAGIAGNITKATLMFPDTVSAINLIENRDEAVAFGKKLGMSNTEIESRLNEFTNRHAAPVPKKDITTISSASATASAVMKGQGINKAHTLTFQINPSSIQIMARGGGRGLVSNYGKGEGNQRGELAHKAIDPYINISFRAVFDATNIADAFMEDRLSASPVNLAKNAITAAVGHEYSVRNRVEGFLAALRNENHRVAIFQWGRLRYTGVLNSISGRYTMFNTAGNPIRAEIQVGMLIGTVQKDSLDRVGYMSYWKDRYAEIINEKAKKDKDGDAQSMSMGNVKSQYGNLLGL